MKDQESQGQPASGIPQFKARRENYRDLVRRAVMAGAILCFMIFVIPAHWRFVYFSTGFLLLAVGVGVRVAQINFPGKYEFIGFRISLVKWYENLSRRHQLYLNVTLCVPFLSYLYVLDADGLFAPASVLFFIYCLGVVSYDVCRIYAIIFETLIGKGVIAVVFAVGSNLAFSISGKIIGELTHVPPTTFPHTLSFLAILAIPFLFVATGTIFIPVACSMAPLLIYGSSFAKKAPRFVKWFFGVEFNDSQNRYIVPTLIFQMVFYLAVGAFTPAAFLFVINKYSQQIELTIGRSIYEFDMYPGTECKTAYGYRQASLGDENYILASKQSVGITFENPRKCSL